MLVNFKNLANVNDCARLAQSAKAGEGRFVFRAANINQNSITDEFIC